MLLENIAYIMHIIWKYTYLDLLVSGKPVEDLDRRTVIFGKHFLQNGIALST